MFSLKKQERASASRRRPVGNFKVILQQWDDLEDVSLSGPKISLEPIKVDRDTADIFTAATEGTESEQIWDYLSYGPFSDEMALRDWLLGWENSKDPVFMVFRDKVTGQCGGMGGFMRIQPIYGVAEIGHIWFGLSCRIMFGLPKLSH